MKHRYLYIVIGIRGYLSSKVTRLYLPTPTWYSFIPDLCTVFLYSSTSVNDSQLTNISDDDDYKTIKAQRRVLSDLNYIKTAWFLHIQINLIRVKVVKVVQQYFSYFVVVSFFGGGNVSTRRKPPTCRKSLTNLIT